LTGLIDLIKYLYEKFLFRDVFSLMTPGAVVAVSATYVLFPDIRNIYFPWPFYIPMFGIFFIIGFSLQCLAELLNLVQTQDLAKSTRRQRFGFLSCNWIDNVDKLRWWKDRYPQMVKFLRQTQDDKYSWARQQRERLVALKQMCGNNFIGFVFSGIFIATYYCPFYVKYIWVSIVSCLLIISLLWGHRVHVLRQYDMSEEILNQIEDK
jgi:hypothetical protein